MNRNKILRITILPLILVAVLAFTNMPTQKNENKNNKSQEQNSDNGKGQGHKGNNHKPQNDKGREGRSQDNNAEKNNKHVNANRNKQENKHEQGNNKGVGNSKSNRNNESLSDVKNSRGNGNSRMKNGKRDVNIDWNLDGFSNWKHPKDRKKVTICHNPSGNNSNGVTISVSENALQAHLNHGDQTGNCTVDYSDRWSPDYIRSRENVYNVYEQTWETMSYSEALLKLALEKLLGVRTDLDRNRSRYTTQELQRREELVYDLENNVLLLQNQLGATRQRLDSDVNIIIQL